MKSILFPQFSTNPITGYSAAPASASLRQIKLPKLGKVQINLHRPIPEGFAVKQVRILKKVEKQHNHIAFKRKDYQFKLAHKLCDMADTLFLEDIDFRIMAKGFLGKHILTKAPVDAAFGQFRTILAYVGKQRGVYVAEVNHKGTSQTCPNCRIEVKKELKDRWHNCPECRYQADRDVASAQEICNR